MTKASLDWVASWEVTHNTLSPAAAQEYEWLQNLLQGTLIAPPGGESAVFRAMTTLPGLRVEQGLTSATGAPAQGISFDGGVTDLLFSPSDNAYIGVRSIDTPVGSRPTDTVPSTTSTTAAADTTSTATTPGSSTDGLTIWTVTSISLVRGPGSE